VKRSVMVNIWCTSEAFCYG